MQGTTKTVLIIEDFLPDRELYRRCLLTDSHCTYRFLETESAKVALQLCQTQKIDVIILDYSLPDSDGLTFLQTLRVRTDAAPPPVVMVTGQGDEMVAARAFKLGVEDYLIKQNISPELLQLTLRSAIENTRLRLQLQESKEHFRTSVENMLDCFGIYSAIRDSTGQIVDFRIDYLNAAALESNQMTVADLGKPLCELLPAHRELGLFAEYCQLVETGEPLVKEGWVYSDEFGAEHLTRAYDIRASKLDDGFVACWRDVTVRQQAERERLQLLIRERLLNQMMQQIHRSLEVDQVLNTAVTEVRQVLKADRAFIFRFAPDFDGTILVESVGEGWSSALNMQIEDTWFMETRGETYRQGQVQIIENIYEAGLSDCHVEMLAQFQVQANLVVPILQGEHLWGLLVLNQCAHPRPWQPIEVDLLQQLATQIGIAVYQAELYQQMQAELREHQTTAAELQESQNFIQQVSDAAPGFLYLYDLQQQRNVYCNRRITDVLGYSPEEIQAMGDTVLSYLLHPDDWGQIATNTARFQAAEPGENFESEYRLRHGNGEWRCFFAREMVYRRTETGAPHLILGMAQEISDRKQLEVALVESERRFREIFNTAYQFIGLLTPEGIVLEANQTALDFAGLDRQGVIGRPFWEVRWWTVSPATQQQLQSAIAQAAQGNFVRYEVEVLGIGNTTTTIDFSLKPVCDESGQVVLLIPEGRDISDAKQAAAARQQNEQRLRESEERLQLGVKVAGVALAKCDYASNTIALSPEAAALYGIPPDQLVISRDRIHATFHPEEQETLARIIDQVLDPAGCDWFTQDHRVVWPTGEVRWLSVRKQVFFDRSGTPRPDYAILAAINITDRKQAEANYLVLLEQANTAHAAAEAANRSKDEFVALVAHELRSPLNAVLGWAKLLQSQSLDAATSAQALEIITRNTYAQVQLIEDLLDVSRIARGTLQLTLTPVNLGEVVTAAVQTVRPTAVAKQIQLEVRCQQTTFISGDFNRLQQVILNLLTNAIKFTPEAGRVELILEQQQDQIQIQVRDTGKGISPDFLPYIFERFSQDQQNTTAKQGLGLGLAIVKHLVELHGGTITVASAGEGQGATFTLVLPVLNDEDQPLDTAIAQGAESPPGATSSLPLEAVRVVLVDDEPDILELTAFILEDAGAIVQTASSAAAALELLAEARPDVLVSDIAMPIANGYDLLQQIRVLYPASPLVAIAMTADSSKTLWEESLRVGYQQHLIKPIEPEQLITAIMHLLGRGGC